MSANKEDRLQVQTSRPKKFRFEYLERITEKFSPGLIIGRGGFGTVYKGKKDNGEFIAVKMLNQTEMAQLDDAQFKKEVLNVMHISHPNIVRLEGYCISKDEELITHNWTHVFAENQYRLICFEYLPSGSLDAYLNNKDKCRAPNWNERYNIIRGICKGLHYLHEGRRGEYILHLDLKPANVLLDKNMMPKIADFGQSRLRLLNEGQTHTTILVCTRVDGGFWLVYCERKILLNKHWFWLVEQAEHGDYVCTPSVSNNGYMPPEYITRGVLSKKTDIYSLGVVVMEIIAGERKYPDDQLDEVRRKWKETLSASGREEYEQLEKCIQLALDCMDEEPEKRLDMKQVVKILGISEDDMNHHPDGIEEHSVINIDSSEVEPLLEQGNHGLLRRRTMTADNKESSPPEILESSMTAELRRMMNSEVVIGVPIANIVIGLLGAFVLMMVYVSLTPAFYGVSGTMSVTVVEASFTRFALATTSSSSSVLIYNLSVTMMFYNPDMFVPTRVTKPLEAAFIFGGQSFHVVELGDGALTTTVESIGPLSGNVTLDAAGVAEYRKGTSTGSLFEITLLVSGQVVYMVVDTLLICILQATCPFKLRPALLGGTTELELLQKVKCTLHKSCSGHQ